MGTLSNTTLSIRNETVVDVSGIREVERRAFGRDDEADLVERLRADGEVLASLIALHQGEVIGHALFSRLTIEQGERALRAAALGPMAVAPEQQGNGIGSMLVMRGLDLLRRQGVAAVLVVGHPEYYPRFGFSAELAAAIDGPYSGEAFMALELTEGALAEGGTARYPAAFADLD